MPVTINIKMYCIGELGDCFLLRFTDNNTVTHVLIDCGSYWNNKSSIKRLREIATDIKEQVKGHKLDIIVGTHQHCDHLSGFIHAKDIFRSITPEQVWLSWLDDPSPDNKQGRKIGEDYNNYLSSLRNINKELGKPFFGDADSALKNRINNLLGFYGINKTEEMDVSYCRQ